MSLRILPVVMASVVLASVVLAVVIAHPAAAQEKKLSAQQLKMKSCAAQWKDEKAAKKVSGRAEYNKFLRGCLKK